jgi:hypothetical protein
MRLLGKFKAGTTNTTLQQISELVRIIPSKVELARLAISTNVGTLDFSTDGNAESILSSDKFARLRSAIEHFPSAIKFTRISLSFRLSSNHNWKESAAASINGVIGEFSTDFNSFPDDTKDSYLEFVSKVTSIFRLTDDEAILRDSLDKASLKQLEYKDLVVSDLQRTVEQLGSYLADGVKRQAEELRQANEKMRSEWESKRSQLEEQFSTRENDLERQKALFEQQEKEFDTRRAQLVRRSHLAEILTTSEKQRVFNLSRQARLSRMPIHFTSGLALCLAVSAAALGGFWLHETVSQDKATSWLFLSMTIAGTAGAASIIVFYLKWANAWFVDHLRHETTIQRMAVDALRASWLVEFLFEWNSEKEQEVPELLLDRLSKDLFSGHSRENLADQKEGLVDSLRGIRSIAVGPDSVKISKVK